MHRRIDVNAQADNDEKHLNDWTNWCGPRVGSPSLEYLSPSQRNQLASAFQSCQDASEEVDAKIARKEQGSNSNESSSYVFQILGSNSGEVIFTWPPTSPTGNGKDLALYGPQSSDGEERYSAAEYAALARGVALKPRTHVAAETNCTKRFQSQHPMWVAKGSLPCGRVAHASDANRIALP